MRFIVVLILVISSLVSCHVSPGSGDARQETTVIKVNFNSDNPQDTLRLSDIFSEVQYVKLSDIPNASVGNISSVRINSERIYLQDMSNKQIVVYDREGNYLMNIHRRGRGPGEYVSLTQFDVNDKTGEISILDLSSRKMLVYDPSGDFLRDFSIVKNDDVPRDFAILDNGDYVFYSPDYNKGTDHYGIWQTDSLGVENKQILEIPKKYEFSAGLFPKYFHHLGENVYVKGREFDGALYHIGTDSYDIPYVLDVDIKLSKDLARSKKLVSKIEDDLYIIMHYLETNKWMYVQLFDMKKAITVLYDKHEEKPYYISSENPIVEDMPQAGSYITTTEDAFVGLIQDLEEESLTVTFSYVK